VVPVRITKSWVSTEVRGLDNRKEPKVVRKFMVTRVSEGRMGRIRNERDPEDPVAPPWQSSHRVETRERLMTLLERGQPEGECLVREAGYDQCWLPYAVPANPTAAQAAWSLENGNGWVPEREAA